MRRIAIVALTVVFSAMLLPAEAQSSNETGSISGTVKSESDEVLSEICVQTYGDHYWSATVRTDDSGAYTVSDLPSDSYRVRFSDCGSEPTYVTEWYADRPDYGSADPVEVDEGEQVSGIDAELVVGGEITGTVTDEAGEPLGGICVWADRDTDEEPVSGDGFRSDVVVAFGGRPATDDSGAYRIGALQDGDYRVHFWDCNRPRRYLDEWYDGQPDHGSADTVPVSEGEETSGIDAGLALGGWVQGRVTDPEGDPVADICVDVEDGPSFGYARTGEDGTYLLGALRTGTYRVRFRDCSWPSVYQSEYYDSVYQSEYYDDVRWASQATPLDVVEGEGVFGIDADLAPPPDVAVSDLDVENVSLRTDSEDTERSVGWVRDVRLELSNLGHNDARDVRLTVRACPETIGRCQYVADESVSVPAQDEQPFTYRWNGFGSLGDVEVTAEIESADDPDPTNDRAAVQDYVVVGGTGLGVGL